MERNIKTYMDLMGMNVDVLPISLVSDVLRMATKDGVTKLKMTQCEYETIQHWMVYSGQWNWDKKTFMGIEFIVNQHEN